MGQKVNANGLRVGVIKDWNSRWYADDKDFADNLIEDQEIRKFIKTTQYQAGVSRVVIERFGNENVKIHILTSKPGMIIGRGGAGIDELRKNLEKITDKKVLINIAEVENSDTDAQLIAENIASQLERRISFRRAMKQAMQRALRAGAQGIKTEVSGRINGVEIARREHYSEGNVPMQTLRADITMGFAEADTTYGKIGVKVWVNNGEVLTGMEDILELPGIKQEPKKEKKKRRKRNNNRRKTKKN